MSSTSKNLELVTNSSFCYITLRVPQHFVRSENLDRDRHSLTGAARRLRLGISELERQLGQKDENATEKIAALRASVTELEEYFAHFERAIAGALDLP